MRKMNCWEYGQCGLEPGGARAAESGPCPAAVEAGAHGLNGGINGGRSCWVIPGTLCRDEQQTSLVQRRQKCIHCRFHALVRDEEAENYAGTRKILKAVRRNTGACVQVSGGKRK